MRRAVSAILLAPFPKQLFSSTCSSDDIEAQDPPSSDPATLLSIRRGCQCASSLELKQDLGLPAEAGAQFTAIWLHNAAISWKGEKERLNSGKAAVGLEYYQRVWDQRQSSGVDTWLVEEKLPHEVLEWHRVVFESVEGSFAEIYGPDGNGDYIVVERASKFLQVFQRMKTEPKLFEERLHVPSFRSFRVWWYEAILAFCQSQAVSMCGAGDECRSTECQFPRILYILHVDVAMDLTTLRNFYRTFEYWKTIAVLGDNYPGVSTGTVFFTDSRIFRTALKAVKTFSTSRDIHVLNSREELQQACKLSFRDEYLPPFLGGDCDAPAHIIL